MILIFLVIVVAICVVAFGSVKPVEKTCAPPRVSDKQRRREAEEEERKKKYPYGEDEMGKVISFIARDSNGGAQEYLDSIPAKKTYKTKKMGGRTYECVTWSEGGKNEAQASQ